MTLCCDVLTALEGKTLVTAESITGGGIGSALTAVPGSSAVYKGGVISYCNDIKHRVLGVSQAVLDQCGAVSAPVAEAMALGARNLLEADVAVSVTGLAGPGADEYGNPVGTVYIGFADAERTVSRKCLFSGDRTQIREQTVNAALALILEMLQCFGKRVG